MCVFLERGLPPAGKCMYFLSADGLQKADVRISQEIRGPDGVPASHQNADVRISQVRVAPIRWMCVFLKKYEARRGVQPKRRGPGDRELRMVGAEML